MAQLSVGIRSAVRQFAYWVANRSVGHPILDGLDYSCVFEEPSAMEAAFSVFLNVLEVDEDGAVLNEKAAERRAAECIREYCDPGYEASPPLEVWETELPFAVRQDEAHNSTPGTSAAPGTRLNLVVLRSADPDRSARLYGSLGIVFNHEQHGSGPKHFAATFGDVVLEIYPESSDRRSSPHTHLGFSVPDLLKSVTAFCDAGGRVARSPKVGRLGERTVLEDLDGGRIDVESGSAID